ncbi:MAG: (2Fe-2S)-binding protein [Planctomycetota bacterium]|jgi:aerobic-type carbon monoxide dehydrogenase small subunit (CoxS/CutS family)
MPDDRTSTGSGVSRRRFLQTLGVSAAAAPLARSADAQQRGRTGTDGVAILGPGPVNISLRINGKPYQATIDPAATLLDALRIDLNLTGTKEICDRGACGGCSVLVDGKLTASCMMLAVDAIGSEITTVEGLAEGDRLDPVQESFVRHDALQCGYCTPGMIMAAKALLNENPRPTPQEIKRGLGGNLCRCGTYTNVVNAVLDASGQAPIRDGGGG